MEETYNLIILGGGPAGYLAAEKAGQAGLKTLLIEKKALGGVCLNAGCIPSKTFLHSAKLYDYAGHSEKYGVKFGSVTIDQKAVKARKDEVVKTLTEGVAFSLKKSKVQVINGNGQIMGKTAVGFKIVVDDNTYLGEKLLIATGSQAAIPNITGITEAMESGFVLTNQNIFDVEAIPNNLTIIGGGIIGLELAAYFNSVGSKTTVIEFLDHVAGDTDRDISNLLLKSYQEKGMEFILNAKVTAISKNSVEYERDGEKQEIKADKVLLAVGRVPVTSGFGLETLNPELIKGAIKIDEYGLTSVSGLYAAGDVTGVMMLAHVAYRQSEAIINNLLGNRDRLHYEAIPSVIYTNPEVASVGLTLDKAEARGYSCQSIKIPMSLSGRYLAENADGKGFCKVVVNKNNRQLLGVHIIGSYASEIIYGAALMIEKALTIDEIKTLVFPHPTISEIIKEAVNRL